MGEVEKKRVRKKAGVVGGALRGLSAEAGRAEDGGSMKNSSIQCAKSATTLNPIVLHVGLDVHKDSIAVAVADADREQPVRFL